MTTDDLGWMLGRTILDLEDAAAFLGIEAGSLWAAARSRRVCYVQYRTHKYFTAADLAAYAAARAPGMASALTAVPAFEIIGEGQARWVREIPATGELPTRDSAALEREPSVLD